MHVVGSGSGIIISGLKMDTDILYSGANEYHGGINLERINRNKNNENIESEIVLWTDINLHCSFVVNLIIKIGEIMNVWYLIHINLWMLRIRE